MREDSTQRFSFKHSAFWKNQRYGEELFLPRSHTNLADDPSKPKFVTRSLSGNERNRMFIREKDNFLDVSLVSGADDLADGRSFGLIDFDQDGWMDIALMSLSKPRFKLYRNDMQAVLPNRFAFRFRLVGGHTLASPSTSLSNRSAIGAQALVVFESNKKILLHKQSGEGYASQNSETLSIGIPESDKVARLEIRWPSGLETVVESPDPSELLTVYEVEQ